MPCDKHSRPMLTVCMDRGRELCLSDQLTIFQQDVQTIAFVFNKQHEPRNRIYSSVLRRPWKLPNPEHPLHYAIATEDEETLGFAFASSKHKMLFYGRSMGKTNSIR